MAEAAMTGILEEQRPRYQFVDDIPEVREARDAERAKALALMAGRSAIAAEGGQAAEELPLPVDALSTAHKVLAAGSDPERQQEHRELRAGLVQDCLRLVGEAFRTMSSEYFEPIRHRFDQYTQSFFSHGLSIRQMTMNGLTPIDVGEEEEARRVNEYVENETTQIMRSLGFLAAGASVLTISECPAWALDRYEDDVRAKRPTGGYLGYVPQISKNMFRGLSVDKETDDRFQVQVGMSGKYHDHDVIVETLERLELRAAGMDKTRLHGAQIRTEEDIFDFIKVLDEVATEQWSTEARGLSIFMGETVPKDFVKDYDAYKRDAIGRQEKLRDFADILAVYVMDLADDKVDPRQALPMIEQFVKLELLNIAKSHIAEDGDVEVAEQMFAEHTVKGLQGVVALERQGLNREAQDAFNDVSRLASIGFCGAGSCDLERIVENTAEAQEVLKKLGASSTDTVVKDKLRACTGCGTKGVWYAYSKSYVKKLCTTCGVSENKVSQVV
jgi:hypothetical protein